MACTETEKQVQATVVRIQGNRIDVKLDEGGVDMIISLMRQKPGLYVGTRSGLEFVMRI